MTSPRRRVAQHTTLHPGGFDHRHHVGGAHLHVIVKHITLLDSRPYHSSAISLDHQPDWTNQRHYSHQALTSVDSLLFHLNNFGLYFIDQ